MIEWLHSIRVRSQVIAALSVVPLVLALLGLSIVPQVVDSLLVDDIDELTLDAVVRAVRLAVLGVVLCGVITALGAAALLRSSLRASVDSIRLATEAIASGDFAHRIASSRPDELGSLARAVDTAAVRLERLEQARRQMLACVSHELRTPLTIASNLVFSLGRSERSGVDAERLTMLDEELLRLGTLIGDLVDAASLHAGGVRLARERADLATLVADAVERFRVQADERGAKLAMRVLKGEDRRRGIVDVDGDRFQQILGNLITNAIRHCDPGSCVTVEVRPGARDGGIHEVRVINTGERIPAALSATIFEPFAQHGERCGRVGLGLAIARDLAESHGGALVLDTAESEAVGGACFVLRLPAAEPRVKPDRVDVAAAARSRAEFAT